MIVFIEVQEDNTITGYGSSSFSDKCIEIDIEEGHDFLESARTYSFIDGTLVKNHRLILDLAKDDKNKELDQNCKDSILAGFEHTINGEIYWFSYDMEAQGNFRDGREVLKDGLVEFLPWTVRAGGIDGPYTRIVVNFEIMSELTIAAMIHKTEKISKYRDFLMPIVEGATSVEEIDEVQW